MNAASELTELRLDKWLWAARFFKTRPLAVEAINGGKIQVNGQRAKPSHSVRAGQQLTIHKDSLIWDIEVLALNRQRRPASEAALLYREEEASRERRAVAVQERRDLGSGDATKPNKRERRLIQQFTGRGETD